MIRKTESIIIRNILFYNTSHCYYWKLKVYKNNNKKNFRYPVVILNNLSRGLVSLIRIT